MKGFIEGTREKQKGTCGVSLNAQHWGDGGRQVTESARWERRHGCISAEPARHTEQITKTNDSPGSPYSTDGIMFDFLLSHAVRRVQNANHMENSCYNLYVVSLTFESPEIKISLKHSGKNTQSMNLIASLSIQIVSA